jgi:cell division septal protein FtsQ
MVIDLTERRAERERRKAERYANPSAARDFFEAATAYVVVMCALGVVIWVLLQPRG